MKTTSYALLTAAMLVFGGSCIAQETFNWPEVIPVQKTFQIDDARLGQVDFQIPGVDQRPLYALKCLGSKKFRDDLSFNWSGDFDCRLTSLYSQDYYSTLLTENPEQERDWDSRGRFFSADVFPGDIADPCYAYPEYGGIRHFRLRGMELTLQIYNPAFYVGRDAGDDKDQNVLKSFDFKVSVARDPEALSAIAEPTLVADNRSNSCRRVTTQHVVGVIDDKYIRQYSLAAPYPKILATRKTVALPGSNDDFAFADVPLLPNQRGFYLPVRDSLGALVYEFECSSLDPIQRWGISCGLFMPGKKVDLLRDSTDVYSREDRGTVFPEELEGKCADYPDLGAIRIFRLRGFRLTMSLTNPEFVASDVDRGGKGIQKVTMTVDIRQDISANSPVAAAPQYAYWDFMQRANACETPLPNPWYTAPLHSTEGN